MQHMATANGITRDKGDDDLGHRADEALEVEDVETWDAIFANIAPGLVAPNALVAARAEGMFAVGLGIGPAEKDDAN